MVPFIPLGEGASFWKQGHPRNLAVGCQKLYGSNKEWKKYYGYRKRSLSKTAMYRVKQLFGGKLSLRNYSAQVGETYAMLKALNKLTGLGMAICERVIALHNGMIEVTSQNPGIAFNITLPTNKSIYSRSTLHHQVA